MSTPATDTEVFLADVLLLCTECGEAIKGRINTQQWIRVDFIGPDGQCQGCYNAKKKAEQQCRA